MTITEILKNGNNVQLVINALDLKEAFLQWSEEAKANAKPVEEEKYLTANETAKKCGVDLSTLWRWDKTGYLKKIKLGNKVYYRESDIFNLLKV